MTKADDTKTEGKIRAPEAQRMDVQGDSMIRWPATDPGTGGQFYKFDSDWAAGLTTADEHTPGWRKPHKGEIRRLIDVPPSVIFDRIVQAVSTHAGTSVFHYDAPAQGLKDDLERFCREYGALGSRIAALLEPTEPARLQGSVLNLGGEIRIPNARRVRGTPGRDAILAFLRRHAGGDFGLDSLPADFKPSQELEFCPDYFNDHRMINQRTLDVFNAGLVRSTYDLFDPTAELATPIDQRRFKPGEMIRIYTLLYPNRSTRTVVVYSWNDGYS